MHTMCDISDKTAPRRTSRRRSLYAFVATGVIGIACLVPLECISRVLSGLEITGFPLAVRGHGTRNPNFYGADPYKIWNSMHVEEVLRSSPRYFDDWPVRIETFSCGTKHPYYIFKPNISLTKRTLGEMVAAQPGDRIMWSTNSWGLRGRHFQSPKPPGVFRVICLGGSTTEGSFSYGNEETYPAQLERALSERYPGVRIEVVNAGHHGYLIDDITALVEMHSGQGAIFRDADLILLYSVINNIRFQPWTDVPFGNPAQAPLPGWMASNLALYGIIRNLVAPERGYHPPHGFINSESLVRETFEPAYRNALAQGRNMGVPIVALTFCHVVNRNLRMPRSHYRNYTDWLYGKWHPFTYGEIETIISVYNDSVKRAVSDSRAMLIDMEAFYPKDTRYFDDAFHFTPEGNRMFAEILAENLAEDVLSETPDGLRVRPRQKMTEPSTDEGGE